MSIEIILFAACSRSLSSLHVKVLLVSTAVSVSLSMSGTPIIVTVSPDSAELTANVEVKKGLCVGTFFFRC